MQGGTKRGDRLKGLPRIFIIILLLAAAMWKVSPAEAQQSRALFISAPVLDSFPTIQFRMDAYDAQGIFVKGLAASDLQILEDGQPLKAQSVTQIQTGLQTILVLNTSQAMANQSSGISTYKALQKALADWAQGLPAQGTDDYSFSTPTGLFLIREHNPALLVKAINDYQPDLAKTQPSLGSLAEALDLATDPLGQSTSKRAILYITPTLPDDSLTTLTDLTNRAKKVGVRVNIWLVSTAAAAARTSAAPDPLQQMALDTGGQYQVLLPNTPLPQIDPLFQSLRSTYQISYTSDIQKSGQHTLSVNLTQTGAAAASNQDSFDLTVQPPNPIFLSPPATIQRSWTSAAKNAVAALSPDEVSLQILIDFPDQHRRAIKATRLYVNDKLVQENTTAPFDRFTWTVSNLTAGGKMTLRAEAVDTLNLTGTSMEVPVAVVVDAPIKTSMAPNISRRGMIAIAAVAAAGGVLAMVLVLTSTQRRSRRGKAADKKRLKDPLTQPVPVHQDASRPVKAAKNAPSKPKPAGWPAPSWPRPAGQNAPARLIVLDESEQPVTGGIILLTRQEITLGKDPQRATQVLDSPTVDDLHARLYRDDEGNFFIADQGSVAGTWINFAPVTSSGARLENGDLIHIGKMMFRFELTDQNQSPHAEIKVTDLEIRP